MNLFELDYNLKKGIEENIKDFVKKLGQKKMKVIDYGCGQMPYKCLFPKNIDYIGVDLKMNKLADIKISKKDKLPFNRNEIDAVISTQVIHKVENYNFYLKNINRILKSRGILFLTTHGNWTHHPFGSGDYYRFTIQGIKKILSEHNFKIIKVVPIVGTLGAGLHIRQIVINAWLKKIPLIGNLFCKIFNLLTNTRIILEDKLQSYGTSISNPAVLAVTAVKIN
jgi:ubiquinone/menaquinone biosynthesis C-methylase UbiE